MPRGLRILLVVYGQGFGLGRLSFMPGTWGTLPALPIAWLIQGSYALSIIGYCVLLLLGYFAADLLGKELGDSDHKSIVCDEIIGILPVLLLFNMQYWIWAFIVFRFFDILKPWPISYIDKHIKGAWGCLIDDVLAGLFTLFLLYWAPLDLWYVAQHVVQ